MKRRITTLYGTKSAFALWTTACVLSLLAGPIAADPGDNSLVSVEWASQRAAGGSEGGVSLSGNGRYVAFDSGSSTLVQADTNGFADIFVRDRATGITERVNVGLGGTESNWISGSPSISADGRYVLFESWASNLVLGDTNGAQDVYLYDRQTRTTRRVSVGNDGIGFADSCESGGISHDGGYVAFSCRGAVYLRDIAAGTTTTIAPPASAYDSYATINGDGRYVLYTFSAEGPLYVYGRLTDTSETLPGLWGVLSRDGRWLAYATDTSEVSSDVNGVRDIYLLDRSTGAKRLVSVGADGAQSSTDSYAAFAVSGDGRHVVFGSIGDGLVPHAAPYSSHLLVKDMLTGAVEYVASSYTGASLSGDARFLAFDTEMAMVAGDRNGSYVSYDDVDTYVHEVGQSSTVPLVYIYQLRPSRIDFGDVPLRSSGSKGFLLVNTGSNTALPITTVELLGLNPHQFTVRNTCSSPLAVDDRCWISVTFKPTSVGYKQAQLHVVAGGSHRYRIVTGTGVR